MNKEDRHFIAEINFSENYILCGKCEERVTDPIRDKKDLVSFAWREHLKAAGQNQRESNVLNPSKAFNRSREWHARQSQETAATTSE